MSAILACLLKGRPSRRLGEVSAHRRQRRSGLPPVPAVTVADLLTLARAGLSLPAWATIVAGRAQRAAFWGALLASTLLDAVDGRLARCLGPTPLGAVLDIEVDSWLTLSAALAGVRRGRLPWPGAIPPIARYVLAPGPAADLGRWHQVAGRVQMAVLLLALSPFPRAPSPRLVLALAALQLAALLDLAQRRARRGAAAAGPSPARGLMARLGEEVVRGPGRSAADRRR
ncbi:MAG TPA: CDP-alcohol phosphatidyltransferase family protein [Candidatus Dormibacteraeota bacterium]|nr:CDP-alcohol phosphatidyltransferase family protein [Candidatus Dormibacteraeota bacterium]